ncbi:hypothetical protein LguiA_004935 [Lonicera macranthoides]
MDLSVAQPTKHKKIHSLPCFLSCNKLVPSDFLLTFSPCPPNGGISHARGGNISLCICRSPDREVEFFEALGREFVKAPQEGSTSKVRCLIPTRCAGFTSPHAFVFDYNMGSKLEDITERLQELSTSKKDLGLKENVKGSSYMELEKEKPVHWWMNLMLEDKMKSNEQYAEFGKAPTYHSFAKNMASLINSKIITEFMIILDKNNTLTTTELRGLSDLRGTLAIIRLHNVMIVQDAREDNFLCMQGLEELTLTWSSVFDDSRSETLEYEVLKPHTKLAKLKIVFYGGIAFLSWVCDPSFVDITNLTVGGCKRFVSLPPLKELFIEGMVGVKNVGDRILRGLVSFPERGLLSYLDLGSQLPTSLTTLQIRDLVSIESLSMGLQNLISLETLGIKNCPKLQSLPETLLPTLQVWKFGIPTSKRMVFKGEKGLLAHNIDDVLIQ